MLARAAFLGSVFLHLSTVSMALITNGLQMIKQATVSQTNLELTPALKQNAWNSNKVAKLVFKRYESLQILIP